MNSGPRLLSGVAALCLSGALWTASRGVDSALAAAPQDEVALVIGPGGWSPARVQAHRGTPLRVRIKAEGGEHCFALDELRIERRVVAGRETTVDLVPDHIGSFTFYDCLAPEGKRASGKLVVSD